MGRLLSRMGMGRLLSRMGMGRLLSRMGVSRMGVLSALLRTFYIRQTLCPQYESSQYTEREQYKVVELPLQPGLIELEQARQLKLQQGKIPQQCG
jgi:hypothetical protein